MEGTRLLDGMYDEEAGRFVGVVECDASMQIRSVVHLIEHSANLGEKRDVDFDLAVQ